MNSTTLTFLDRAAALLPAFSLIPLQPASKAPFPGIGAFSRSKDPAVIQEWAERFPDANVGIVADDEIVILETDNLEQLKSTVKNGTGRELPETLMSAGSSENRPHMFFRRTARASNVGCIAVPGLFECRFSNQYVCGPGSQHPDGISVYRFLNDAPIVEIPDWLVSELARLAITQKTERKNPTTNSDGTIPEGSRHYSRMSALGKAWDGKKSEAEMLAVGLAVNERCNPPESEAEVLAEVRDVMKREPYNPGPKVVIGTAANGNVDPDAEPIRTGGHFDFVLSPPEGGIDGAFALGSVHLIFGSSGTGKSTLGLQMLRAQKDGQPFFGHESYGRSYLYLMKDRGKHETARTFKRLGVDSSVPIAQVQGGVNWQKAVASIQSRFLEASQPEIVFVEGLDMCLEDPNNPAQVGSFMEALMELAERYHVSIIGTVGAPKLKKNEQYSPRDGMFGSSFWARKADTMVRVTKDHETGLRDVILMYRNSPDEKFTFQFNGWLMEPVEQDEQEPEDAKGAVKDWLEKQADWMTAKQIRMALLLSEPATRRALDYPWIEKQAKSYPARFRVRHFVTTENEVTLRHGTSSPDEATICHVANNTV